MKLKSNFYKKLTEYILENTEALSNNEQQKKLFCCNAKPNFKIKFNQEQILLQHHPSFPSEHLFTKIPHVDTYKFCVDKQRGYLSIAKQKREIINIKLACWIIGSDSTVRLLTLSGSSIKQHYFVHSQHYSSVCFVTLTLLSILSPSSPTL